MICFPGYYDSQSSGKIFDHTWKCDCSILCFLYENFGIGNPKTDTPTLLNPLTRIHARLFGKKQYPVPTCSWHRLPSLSTFWNRFFHTSGLRIRTTEEICWLFIFRYSCWGHLLRGCVEELQGDCIAVPICLSLPSLSNFFKRRLNFIKG